MVRPGTWIRWNAFQSKLKAMLKEGMTVLDIGGHDGYILNKLKTQVEFNAILADLDLSEDIKETMITPIQASGIKIPLTSESMHLILCLDVIEHISEDRLLVAELVRVLRKGGFLIISTPIANKRLVPFVDMNKLHIQWGHIKPGYSLRDIRKLLSESGLDIVGSSEYFNIFVRYAYFLLLLSNLPLSYPVKRFLFTATAISERFCSLHSLEHFIIAKKHSTRERMHNSNEFKDKVKFAATGLGGQ